MNDIIPALFRTTFTLTLCGGVCLVVLRQVEDRLPGLSRILWLAVLLTGWFWIQPVLQIPCKISSHETVTENINVTAEIPENHSVVPFVKQPKAVEVVSETDEMTMPVTAAKTQTAQPISLYSILFAVWVGGMIVSVLWAAFHYGRFLLLFQKSNPANESVAEAWYQLLVEHKIDPQKIPMFLSENLGPALIRTPKGYRLVVPLELWNELPESGKLSILRHELEHFKRRDVWKSFFVRLLTLPHWFNLMAHFAANRFDDAAEQLCDTAALSETSSGTPSDQRELVLEFARMLLLLHENAPTQFVARQSIFGFWGRGLNRRISRLQNSPFIEKVSNMKKFTLVCGTVIVFAFFLFRFEFVAKTTAQIQNATETVQTADKADKEYLWSSVIDAETKKPLAEVKTTLYYVVNDVVKALTHKSNKEGQIFFPLPSVLNADMEAGTTILVEKDGYVPENDGRQAKWAERFLKEGKIICDVFSLQKTTPITGRLVDEQEKPLQNIKIVVYRQKVKPYGIEGLERMANTSIQSDTNGKFHIDAAQNEKIVFWAMPDNLAPKYVFPDKKRGDFGDIVIEKGFESTVQVLDKDGKPVDDVWVSLERSREGFGLDYLSPYVRPALTDQEGYARFHPVSEGRFEIRVVEFPYHNALSYSIAGTLTWRKNKEVNKKPVKGIYYITPVELSASSSQATIQAKNAVKVDVHFTDGKTGDNRECNVNIHGHLGENFFASRPSSDSPSAYQGEGLFSFQAPIGLEKPTLRIPSDDSTAYRIRINDEKDWHDAIGGYDFELGSMIEKDIRIEAMSYRSPKITLNVVDESGAPVKEYYAWAEYTKTPTPATIKIEGDKIRVDITPEKWHEVSWKYATSEISPGGVLDVTFKYKNFGKDETKINAGGILPNEELRLYIIGKGFEIAKELVPKMSEGEERELTLTLKKR